MKDFSANFPPITNYTYLNTASSGLLPSSTLEWRRQHDQSFFQTGSVFRESHKQHILEIREKIAEFFHAPIDGIGLVPNFSFGYNVLVDAISRQQNILLIDGDYPSVTWPIERRDFDISKVPISPDIETHISEAFKRNTPDIFAFSMVQYMGGFLMDLEFLTTLKKHYPNTLFIADGTQYLGTKVFDFEQSPIDILGASGYKWLLAGYGNGFFMLKEEAKSRLHPNFIGFNSADANFSKKNDIEFVGYLEPGHQDTLNYGSLLKSLEFLDQQGMTQVETHLENLCSHAIEEFDKSNLWSESSFRRKNRSTIFNIKGDERLLQQLREKQILCSLRGKGIRVSLHLYNTEKDIEKLLQAI